MNNRETALEILKSGKVLIYPSDTVWGIGCDARNDLAVQLVSKLKARETGKSYIILLDAAEKIQRYVQNVPDIAYDLIEFSENPLTIVFDKGKNVAATVLAEDGSIAIRVVKEGFCHELIKRFNGPLLSTSANISGMPTEGDFMSIPKELKEMADYVVPELEARHQTMKPSTIMRLSSGGEFSFIRR